MRSKIALLLLASALGGCATAGNEGNRDRGMGAVNVPVVERTDYVFDVAAAGGSLLPGEAARLNAWFAGLDLGYGDAIYVDGPYANSVRDDVARVAGRYGLMVAASSPVTTGAVPSGTVRVIVSRSRASVPGCPNWNIRSQPNFDNRNMSNFGCSVNANLAAQVANPEDLLHGHEGSASVDVVAGSKAIQMYREWPLTGVTEGQARRPLIDISTKKKGN